MNKIQSFVLTLTRIRQQSYNKITNTVSELVLSNFFFLQKQNKKKGENYLIK